jgi:hypothetical protein
MLSVNGSCFNSDVKLIHAATAPAK